MGDFFSDIGNALIPGNSAGLGAVLNNPIQIAESITGQAQNRMAAEQFGQQMDWERYKFNNAHQAEVADLKAAGLNPVLSANGGQGNSAGSLTPTASTTSPQGLLGIIQQLLPNISQIKQANAAETLANAQANKLGIEAGKIGLEKELAELEKKFKTTEYGENGKLYLRKLNADFSKSPLGFVTMLKDMFNSGTHTQTAQKFENIGETLNEIRNSKTYKLMLNTPQGRISDIILKIIEFFL